MMHDNSGPDASELTADLEMVRDFFQNEGMVASPPLQKFDNQPTWDNIGPTFDNQPTWDNWPKR